MSNLRPIEHCNGFGEAVVVLGLVPSHLEEIILHVIWCLLHEFYMLQHVFGLFSSSLDESGWRWYELHHLLTCVASPSCLKRGWCKDDHFPSQPREAHTRSNIIQKQNVKYVHVWQGGNMKLKHQICQRFNTWGWHSWWSFSSSIEATSIDRPLFIFVIALPAQTTTNSDCVDWSRQRRRRLRPRQDNDGNDVDDCVHDNNGVGGN